MPTKAGSALLDTFDAIRIINLKHRNDRRREITEQLARLGLVLGDRIRFQNAFKPSDPGEFPSTGSRGCFMSHLNILQSSYEAGFKNVLILEDDLDFSKDIELRLPSVLEELRNSSWSIFYGGFDNYSGDIKDNGYLHRAKPDETIQTTHFIAFSSQAIEIGMKYLELILSRPAGDPAGGPMHVDGAYSWFRKHHPELVTFLASPELGYQRPSRTDIHALGLKDRLPIIRQAVAMVRRLRRGSI